MMMMMKDKSGNDNDDVWDKQDDLKRMVRKVYANVGSFDERVREKWTLVPEGARMTGAMLARTGVKNCRSFQKAQTMTTTTVSHSKEEKEEEEENNDDDLGICYSERMDGSLLACLSYRSEQETGPSQIKAMEFAFCELLLKELNADSFWEEMLEREYKGGTYDLLYDKRNCERNINTPSVKSLCQIWKCQDPRENTSRCPNSCGVPFSCKRHALSNSTSLRRMGDGHFPIYLHVDLGFFQNVTFFPLYGNGSQKNDRTVGVLVTKKSVVSGIVLKRAAEYYMWIILLGFFLGLCFF